MKVGTVQSVDTGNITIKVDDENLLNSVQVNQIIQIRSTKTREKIIGLISKIVRKSISPKIEDNEPDFIVDNILKVNLIGTLIEKEGTHKNIFKRTLNTVPSINADCFLLEKDELSGFMNIISTSNENPLKIGQFSISENSDANLDGNKFFQRHAVIVGGTGSGKSWTVANIIEKANDLNSSNCILFDLHGEYNPLEKLNNATLLKIAGPSDSDPKDDILFFPYWLLSYEEIEALLLDRSDSNAPNQARVLFDRIIELKKDILKKHNQEDILNNFTINSPIPFDIEELLSFLKEQDTQMVQGARAEKQGPLHGKLTRFIQRLTSKQTDKRLNFIFNPSKSLLDLKWLNGLVDQLMTFTNNKGIKIVDFSEVPSDILPLITGLIGRLIFTVQQWTDNEERHPLALFCDEAHLYIPAHTNDKLEEKGLKNFERIAKEGRKYGLSLVVISQRPADVSKTVLSQCGNFVAMRLTNPDDQNVIHRLFPDSLGDFAELLPILDIGEALIVGDSCLLPSRIKVDPPKIKPNSATVNFWDVWSSKREAYSYEASIVAIRKQQK